MAEEKAVEQKVEEAATQQEKDMADILLETQEELAKTRDERNNYKTGLLKAKGKLSDEDLQAEEDRIRAIAREEYLKTKEGDLAKKQDELIKQLAHENKELRTANRSKAGVTPVVPGAESKDATPPQNSPLSAELITKLKTEKGWTDAMVKELEDKQRARAGTRM
jgi:hypothetical protein